MGPCPGHNRCTAPPFHFILACLDERSICITDVQSAALHSSKAIYVSLRGKYCGSAEGGEVLSWGFPSGNRLGNLLNGDTAQVSAQLALCTNS